MLYTFKSAASGDVIMFGDVAQKLLRILEKDPSDPRGILTVDQLPGAIARLQAAIDADRAAHAHPASDNADPHDDDPADTGMGAPVALYQRAYPLLEMLRYALAEKVPVVWGV